MNHLADMPANVITLTANNFEEIITQHEIVTIDFWAQWCAPCRAFLPILKSAAEQFPQILFAQTNIEEERDLAVEFNIHSIPFLVILRNRVAVYAESGLLPELTLLDLLQQAINLDPAKLKSEE